MTLADVQFLFAYNAWANDRMFTTLVALSDEQFTRSLGGSFPTIRDTAAHLVSAEWTWVRRWKGTSPRSFPEWASNATAATLREHLTEIEQQRASHLESLTDEDLGRTLSFTRFNGEESSLPFGQSLQHVVNHSTYHRGQIVTLLRQVGVTPVSTDLLLYKP